MPEPIAYPLEAGLGGMMSSTELNIADSTRGGEPRQAAAKGLVALLARQALDGPGEARLGARGGVAVDDLLLRRGVDDAERLAEQLRGLLLVAGGDRAAQPLHRGAHARHVRAVAVLALRRLAGPLFGRFGIGHDALHSAKDAARRCGVEVNLARKTGRRQAAP